MKTFWGILCGRSKIAATFVGGVESSQITRWSYDRQRHGQPLAVQFTCPEQMRRLRSRWRVLAAAIHSCATRDEGLFFDHVTIHLGDAVAPDEPDNVLAFSRWPGSRARLIPNPYLLQAPPRLPAPRPWDEKGDSLYFRGASTGASDYSENARVALCSVARTIPRSDCKLSKLRQIDRRFAARLAADALVARPDHVARMNDHRFLADVDGTASSWDRYRLVGMFGGVPIRFETAWEECWHDALVEGHNWIRADRDTLPHVIARLRGEEEEARRIARNASLLAATRLTPAAMEAFLGRVLTSATPASGSI